MTLLYHSLTQQDVTNVMAIENACHSHPWSEKLFASCLDGHYFAEYATLNEKILGFYVAQYVAGEATLMNICVSPIEQGNGYGKELLKRFLSQAKNKGAETAFLELRASNISAQMLYINQGFSEIDRRVGYYPSAKGFGYEDAIVMRKSL